jgi:hypothetical protein
MMVKAGHALMGLATAGVIIAGASGAVAQDQEIYDAIDCSQWTLNSDGTWDTGPRAEIPGTRRRLSNLRHLGVAGFYVNGVDVSAWLNAKCVKKCTKLLGLIDVCN